MLMAIHLFYSGQRLFWVGEHGEVARFNASSGLVGSDKQGEAWIRMFRVGPIVYVFVLDWRCTWYQKMRDHGPIPSGTYQVATHTKGYASYDASICGLSDSYSIQMIPRGGAAEDEPSGGSAGRCEQYWINWGFNRVALAPYRDMVAPHRSGFYIHDSSKGFTHGCIETEQKFFTDQLLPTVKAHPKISIDLKVKYEDGFRTFGNTLAKPRAGMPDESTQKQSLKALEELIDRLKHNAPNDDEKPFVSKYRRPAGLVLDPPPQNRLLKYDDALGLSWGSNNLSRTPDKLNAIPSWWGNFV
jgi:hypothetical protein